MQVSPSCRRTRLLRLHGHVPHGGCDAGGAQSGGGLRWRGPAEVERLTITNTDLAAVYGSYALGGRKCRLVAFSSPQFSLFEMRTLSRHFAGQKVTLGMWEGNAGMRRRQF